MRCTLLIYICIAILAAALAVESALHKSFLEKPIASSIDMISQKYIDRTKLDSEQSKNLEAAIARAKGGEKYLSNLHQSLLRVSIAGFSVLMILSGISAFLAFRYERSISEKNQVASKPGRL